MTNKHVMGTTDMIRLLLSGWIGAATALLLVGCSGDATSPTPSATSTASSPPAVSPQPTANVSPGPPLHHNGQIVMAYGNTLIALDVANGAERGVIFSAPSAYRVEGPAYSPDGNSIAYLRGVAHGRVTIDSIWVLDTRTGHTRQLTTCHECHDIDSISWSPDGSRLVFSEADQYGILQLHLIDADGTHRTQLTHLPRVANAYQPTWSPDGTRIAFASQDVVTQEAVSATVNIDVIRIDGTGLAVLVAAVGQSETNGQVSSIFPAWSPNGSRIAYVVSPDRRGASFEGLWLMNPDGSHRTEVFRSDDCCWGKPVWSPDGTRIVTDAPRSTFWVMNADGSAPKSLGPVSGNSPAWQPVP